MQFFPLSPPKLAFSAICTNCDNADLLFRILLQSTQSERNVLDGDLVLAKSRTEIYPVHCTGVFKDVHGTLACLHATQQV